MKKLQALHFAVTGVAIIVALWFWAALRKEQARNAKMEAYLQSVWAERENTNRKLKISIAENIQLQQRLAQKQPVPANEDAEVENELDAWLGRMGSLKSFLASHPQYASPEMKFLRVKDWLDATKDTSLDNEAEMRLALGRLREAAKERAAPMIQEAIKKYRAANGGATPQDGAALAAYLSDPSDAEIVARYHKPSADDTKGISGADIQLIEQVVDPVWDTRWFFGKGSVGSFGLAVGIVKSVGDAIEKYRQTYGTAPTDSAQIQPFIDRQMDTKHLPEVFAAVQTPVAQPNR